MDRWMKDVAPSDGLRRWYGHAPERYDEFRRRYREELEGARPLLEELAREARIGAVTLLYAARDGPRSNAAVLVELLERKKSRARVKTRGARRSLARTTP